MVCRLRAGVAVIAVAVTGLLLLLALGLALGALTLAASWIAGAMED